MSIADVLDRAADLIGVHGWTQEEWQNEDGCLCAEGALWKAGAADIPTLVTDSHAGKFFRHFIGDHIPRWNDSRGRTPNEVVAKLREAAQLARQEGK